MKKTAVAACAAIFLAAGTLGAADRLFPVTLPGEVQGWAADGADSRYDADTLYDLIDGGAEIYRTFGVRAVLSRRYVRAGEAEIIADVFDMSSPRGAYGAYHFDIREGESASIGRESERFGSSLAFWKDRFYVSITPFAATPRLRETVLGIGRAIADAIDADGSPPDLPGLLPRSGLASSHVHYFSDERILRLLVPAAAGLALGLGDRAEGVLGGYRLDRSGAAPLASLLLLRYSRDAEAISAYASLRMLHADTGRGDIAALQENGRWLAVGRAGLLLAAVWDAPSREEAISLAESGLGRSSPREGGADGPDGLGR